MRPSIPFCLVAVLLLGAVAVYGDNITYTFTFPGVTGTIGGTSFADAVVTVTAIGDTETKFEAYWYPSAYFVVASSLDMNISGIGTAKFLDPGAYGGEGFVFLIQNPLYMPEAYVGFGSNQDHGMVSNSVLSSYDLISPIAVSGNSFINFDPSYYEQVTTLGLLHFTSGSSSKGTFTAAAVPEPSTLALLGIGIVGLFTLKLRRKP